MTEKPIAELREPPHSAEHMLGYTRAMVFSLSIIRGRIGDLTYREQFWPAHYAAKRRSLELEVKHLRKLQADLDGWLRVAQGMYDEALKFEPLPDPPRDEPIDGESSREAKPILPNPIEGRGP